jgi:hypothetical protein
LILRIDSALLAALFDSVYIFGVNCFVSLVQTSQA